MSTLDQSSHAGKVLAWDLPTRLFKWTLVALVVLAWISNEFGGSMPMWHKANGYAILTLVVFRVLWGFVGGTTARFSSFVRSPLAAVRYGIDLAAGRKRYFLGHNPLGAFVILALLGCLGLLGILGLYAADADRLIIEGPLAKTISDGVVTRLSRWHALAFDVLMILVSLHVMAAIFYRVFKKEPSIEAMITGRKPAKPYEDAVTAQPGSALVAMACLAVAALVVFGGIVVMGGNPLR